jgi:hypothetical protein
MTNYIYCLSLLFPLHSKQRLPAGGPADHVHTTTNGDAVTRMRDGVMLLHRTVHA